MKNVLFILIFSLSSCLYLMAQNQHNIDYNKALLIDVRTPQEFAEGSAKGAINIPLHELPSRLSELKTDKPIVVFCRSGARSARALQILKQNGITNAVNGGTWMEVDKKLKTQR
ncbi:rhodanese-like domain-containing protein [Schleiferia thermophila]|jgi:rhodanese-related sulfurtransferase|nr:rhodanese-like domain-containing protein [Schleiferia thermophila]KFD39026.1 sulfurtransferase [Schleiferia thermophila str. Yellowstone]PMB23056.1 sulfurtransferase [Fischerella thermalis CCMEE 5319]